MSLVLQAVYPVEHGDGCGFGLSWRDNITSNHMRKFIIICAHRDSDTGGCVAPSAGNIDGVYRIDHLIVGREIEQGRSLRRAEIGIHHRLYKRSHRQDGSGRIGGGTITRIESVARC